MGVCEMRVSRQLQTPLVLLSSLLLSGGDSTDVSQQKSAYPGGKMRLWTVDIQCQQESSAGLDQPMEQIHHLVGVQILRDRGRLAPHLHHQLQRDVRVAEPRE